MCNRETEQRNNCEYPERDVEPVAGDGNCATSETTQRHSEKIDRHRMHFDDDKQSTNYQEGDAEMIGYECHGPPLCLAVRLVKYRQCNTLFLGQRPVTPKAKWHVTD